MGFLITLGVEIARAIKGKNAEKKKSPERKYIDENPYNINDKENVLKHIDYNMHPDYENAVYFMIQEYIQHYSRDEEIIKRIDLMNKL